MVNIVVEEKDVEYIFLEGAVNKDGSWKRGWQPLGQCYVRKEKEINGVYTVVHNLNTIKYSLIASLLKTPGAIEISNLTSIDFIVTIKEDNKLIDRDFRFAIRVSE